MNHTRQLSQSNSQDVIRFAALQRNLKKHENDNLAVIQGFKFDKIYAPGVKAPARGQSGGGEGYSYNGLYGEAPPERGTSLRGNDFISCSI